MGEMLKKVKHMQEDLKKVQDELKEESYESSVEGVRCVVSGDMEVKEMKIDPAVLERAGAAKLESLVSEAVTSAMHEAKNVARDKLRRVTGGMNIPGLF
jgi:DNA-binding YbaB/EbfC family protein